MGIPAYRAAAASALLGAWLALGCPAEPPPSTGTTVPGTGTHPREATEPFSWRQWGGPNGDFKVADAGLAAAWPAEGPRSIWNRPLGEGYSAIAFDGGVLFTLYRDGSDDVAVALRAGDGETIWEHRYPTRTHPASDPEYGVAPRAMPLVLDDRVVTLGFGGTLNALDRGTGRLLWTRELVSEFDGQVLDYGNSSSPVRYRDAAIVLVGGTRQAVVALDPEDGSAIWRSAPGTISHGTPIVIEVEGQDQLVYPSEDAIVGLDARTGEHRWSFPLFNVNRDNISTPLWGKDRLLWASAQPDGGTRVVRLDRVEERTEVREIWADHRISIHFWNALRLDDHVYASIGGHGTTFACVDVRTGEIAWREREFEKANFVHAGDRTILLDARGRLALVRLSPDGMTVLSQARIADGRTWTVPTLVGTTLYVRDQRTIQALDLGSAGDRRN